jgi:hypothetical protein
MSLRIRLRLRRGCVSNLRSQNDENQKRATFNSSDGHGVVHELTSLDDVGLQESSLLELPVDIAREHERPERPFLAPSQQAPEASMRDRGPVQIEPVAEEAPGDGWVGVEPMGRRHILVPAAVNGG